MGLTRPSLASVGSWRCTPFPLDVQLPWLLGLALCMHFSQEAAKSQQQQQQQQPLLWLPDGRWIAALPPSAQPSLRRLLQQQQQLTVSFAEQLEFSGLWPVACAVLLLSPDRGTSRPLYLLGLLRRRSSAAAAAAAVVFLLQQETGTCLEKGTDTTRCYCCCCWRFAAADGGVQGVRSLVERYGRELSAEVSVERRLWATGILQQQLGLPRSWLQRAHADLLQSRGRHLQASSCCCCYSFFCCCYSIKYVHIHLLLLLLLLLLARHCRCFCRCFGCTGSFRLSRWLSPRRSKPRGILRLCCWQQRMGGVAETFPCATGAAGAATSCCCCLAASPSVVPPGPTARPSAKAAANPAARLLLQQLRRGCSTAIPTGSAATAAAAATPAAAGMGLSSSGRL